MGFIITNPDAAAASAAEGQMLYYHKHQSYMDQFTQQPPTAEPYTSYWSFMQTHYDYMQVYRSWWRLGNKGQYYPRGFVYKDMYAIKPEWIDANPTLDDYVLRDASGNRLFIPFGTKKSALWQAPTGESIEVLPQFAGDIDNLQFRIWWATELQVWLQETQYAGVWFDDVNMGKSDPASWQISDVNKNFVAPVHKGTTTAWTLSEWRNKMALWVKGQAQAVHDLGLLAAANVIFYSYNWSNDPDIREMLSSVDYANLERGITDTGLVAGSGTYGVQTYLSFIDYCHSLGTNVIQMDYSTDVNEIDYSVAGYFLANDGKDLYSAGHSEAQWAEPPLSGQTAEWPAVYDTQLGAASGARYSWNGLIRRDFANGSVLINEPGNPTVSFTLDGKSYTLAGKRGVVHLK